MSLRVVLSEEAEAEIDEATIWYDDRGDLGDNFIAEVRTVLIRIGQTPEMHPVVYNDIRRARVRRFPYAVLYRVEPDRVEVISVFHGSRDPSDWQGRG